MRPAHNPREHHQPALSQPPRPARQRARLTRVVPGRTAGDIAASTETWGYAFRGARIFTAALQSMVQLHGLGSTEGAKILIAGCSAGARGTMFTIDYVPEMLHQLGVANFELVTLLDSPMWVDIDPITGPSGSIMPLMEQTQIILGMLNATYRLGPTCQVAYPETEWWKCLYGENCLLTSHKANHPSNTAPAVPVCGTYCSVDFARSAGP